MKTSPDQGPILLAVLYAIYQPMLSGSDYDMVFYVYNKYCPNIYHN